MNNKKSGMLLNAGFPIGKVFGKALEVWDSLEQEMKPKKVVELLLKVAQCPEEYLSDSVVGGLAQLFCDEQAKEKSQIKLSAPAPFSVYGKDYIQEGAFKQMEVAVRLPVAVSGALMPDAHQGYGLPIGGVLATRNSVIPYGVGVDIGCRMALSIYDIAPSYFFGNEAKFKRELIANSLFGAGAGFSSGKRTDHSVLENAAFSEIPLVKSLKEKAYIQLGSSGGGNHFVEFGVISFKENDESLGVQAGEYVALLTHSGSRGLGAQIANYYTRLAKNLCPLPQEAINLAYLSLDSAEGQEYWMAMNLAGEYASACHEVIHQKMAKSLGATILAKVENHHNFAWKEIHNGEELIVHRKGATPAQKGELGFIPGSMTANGYLVKGRGEAQSLNSASHGAGRVMSRGLAFKSITRHQVKDALKQAGVTLIGGGIDEAPMVYKDIERVMESQQNLVDIIGVFTPKMVRMAEDGSRED